MTFVYPDLVKEVSTTTGATGDIIDLDGAVPGFRSFGETMEIGQRTTICRRSGLNWEALDVRLIGPRSLQILAVYNSTNNDRRINWPAGQMMVYPTQLGRFALLPPDAGQAGRPVVVQPDGTYGAGALDVPAPSAIRVSQLLEFRAFNLVHSLRA